MGGSTTLTPFVTGGRPVRRFLDTPLSEESRLGVAPTSGFGSHDKTGQIFQAEAEGRRKEANGSAQLLAEERNGLKMAQTERMAYQNYT
uniref:Uncharacterized protein n=1 Tax=Oryza rufipogon TaxID=4529 RepID=A0A0E0QLA7_ORYRU